MRSEPVVYDRAGYEALRKAYEETRRDMSRPEAQRSVKVVVKDKPCSYSLHYAKVLLDSLAPAFGQPDMPLQPNLEGDEGQ